MSNTTRTDIPVADLDNFEFFLDSSGLDKVRIGLYNKLDPISPAHVHGRNYVVYEMPDDVDTQEVATMMTLTHGSVEKAYISFRDELEKNISTSTVGYGY